MEATQQADDAASYARYPVPPEEMANLDPQGLWSCVCARVRVCG